MVCSNGFLFFFGLWPFNGWLRGVGVKGGGIEDGMGLLLLCGR